ncbi:glycoside hydrolase family 125 protein [Tengunoibacter tsumagoiensis]|uniref:Glycosyl hydrolase n=1 Tax=Tengunoibacter tsumagoiensis TaxID=2014871 RepID=A0A401ZTJ0_9CHLR|nr:glycoside hydrolase family 125 protein [Tengunoibacter tsumagoiensis]GCE10195.1 glycosyl hydrolase [Tengunoibacter tsumagoiensis]
MTQYELVYRQIAAIKERFVQRPQLGTLFAQCYPNTLETTTELLDDGTTFVFTGDIPAMWLRDSSAQVHPYLPLAAEDGDLQRLFRGLIARQAQYLQIDGYANAFNREASGRGHVQDIPKQGPWVWERKFELDSLCYPINLCYKYWHVTKDATIFTHELHEMFRTIVKIMRTEQHHDSASEYHFERPNPWAASDTLPFDGHGTRTNFTGLIWSGFRPSDDACRFGYLIPANMFAVVVLGYLGTLARVGFQDETLALEAELLRKEVEFGIETYGTVLHPRLGRIYAYETDGYGNYNLMDDANVPNLLSIPYLGYRPVDDPLYQRTRAFVLSPENPYYFVGKAAKGLGSPHTPHGYIWPIGLSMQGLTSQNPEEIAQVFECLANTTAGTNYMHEGFHVDDPTQFTRPWFAWANSIFSEFFLYWAAQTPVGSRR